MYFWPMKKRFAIVGCGRVANRHALEILKHGELTAVCDIIPERADEFAANYGGHPYYNIEDMLLHAADFDVISICTPNGLHARHSIVSLEAGKDVLCEKPLAISIAEGAEMVDVAARLQKKLYVVKQNRFNPPVIALKKLIDSGRLGRLYSFQLNCFWNRGKAYYDESSWRGTRNMDGGILFTQFSHFLDVLTWLLGDIDVEYARVENLNHPYIEIDDSGMAILKTKTGAQGTLNYNINCYSKNLEGSLTIFAEHGTVKIGGQYLNNLEYQDVKGQPVETENSLNGANDYGHYQGSMSNHNHIYEHLLQALSNPAYLYTSAEEGLKTVALIENIYKAAGIAPVNAHLQENSII